MASHVNRPESRCRLVGLEALSRRQRRLVESHLPLVHVTIERMGGLVRPGRVGSEYRDLVQEGCLALVDAVRCHDPKRHGIFPAYAMARIRFAVSRFAHEHAGAVRVPFIEQRRRRESRRMAKNRHDPGEPPRADRWPDSSARRAACKSPDWRATIARGEAVHEDAGGEVVLARCRKAMSDAMEVLSETRRSSVDLGRMLEACYQQRWSIPEPDARTSIRDLAKQLNCSASRISRLESAFYRQTANCMNATDARGEAGTR